ncbi:MAG TPA: tetrahydrofolate dehydrogenase/cyclohydrolase catalytic domain-containing protein, partial [Chloroflexota bacterium]
MTAALIDGRAIAAELRRQLRARAERLTAERGVVPTLAVVWAGYDAASERYSRQIKRDFERGAFAVREFPLSESTPEGDVVDLLHGLGHDAGV